LVLGVVKRNTKDMTDPIIVRRDGGAMYSLATVVDDVELEITHVIRGQEHLTNTFLQVLLYEALGFPIPQFAHIPFICKPQSQKKLSKRDAEKLGISVTLGEYREQGYLSDAIFNYLTHLGWALDDKTEKWDRETFVANFGFDRTVKTPAQFDPEKLKWLQSEHMREIPREQRIWGTKNWLKSDAKIIPDLVDAMGDRLRIYSDLDNYRHFIDDNVFSIDPQALQKRVPEEAAIHLARFQDQLETIELWTEPMLVQHHSLYCQQNQIKPALLIHALRVATTGKMVGMGLFIGLEILGKERVLARIAQCLKEYLKL
jgi:glutamyl-tRNA synthetase